MDSDTKKQQGSLFVAMGIMASRVMGLVRQKAFAHFFGNSDAGDAFYAALKIPNFLQNLLGDGVLSASFIPVYVKLKSTENSPAADRVAGIVGSFLFVITSFLAALGVAASPSLIDWIAPGFHGEKRELTLLLVQIFFPGTAILVMSAWCLGVLNSHRRFFLSYVAPVFWNLAIIFALLWFGPKQTQNTLVVTVAWAVFVGSILQFIVQIPTVLKVAPHLHFLPRKADFKKSGESGDSVVAKALTEIFTNLGPVVFSRGAVQISAYIDNVLASLLPTGAVSAIAYAQSLYLLPVSLFGMSIAAAELPNLSHIDGKQEDIYSKIKERMTAGLRQIAFFVIPTVVGFLVLGDLIVGGLYQGGAFTAESTHYVWTVLAGSTIGLLATTQGRLYSSAFFALKDTKSPLRFALVRVFLTTTLGYICGLKLPGWLGISESFGASGLTASAGLSGWVEFLLLRKTLSQKIGKIEIPMAFSIRLWGSALFCSLLSLGTRLALQTAVPGLAHHPIPFMVMALLPFGFGYLALTYLYFQIPEAKKMVPARFRK